MKIHSLCEKLTRDLGKPIKPSHIRFYEKIDLMKFDRTENKYRVFNDKDYAKLIKAIMLQDLGYNLATIALIFNNDKDTIHAVKTDLSVNWKRKQRYVSILQECL